MKPMKTNNKTFFVASIDERFARLRARKRKITERPMCVCRRPCKRIRKKKSRKKSFVVSLFSYFMV